MNNGNELHNLLRQHSGSEVIYKHPLVASFNYTEGVLEFAQKAGNGAYWMLDILATEPAILKQIKAFGFALVLLKVTGTKFLLTVADDIGEPPIFSLDGNTDCPEAPVTESNPDGVWKFYLETGYVGNGVVTICMLPQER